MFWDSKETEICYIVFMLFCYVVMSIDLIKQLRDETQASIKDIKAAVDESDGDYAKAVEAMIMQGAPNEKRI